jgi:hypothetical protein
MYAEISDYLLSSQRVCMPLPAQDSKTQRSGHTHQHNIQTPKTQTSTLAATKFG